MTTLEKTTHAHRKVEATIDQDSQIHTPASKVGRFFLHLLEMLLAMMVGMGIFHLLVKQIPATSSLATLADKQTVLHIAMMAIFMTVPMLTWMILRGHGWRHSLEMGVAMLAPVAVIYLLCTLGLVEYLPWLAGAGGTAMHLGMLAAMIYRRNHYTSKANRLAHAT
jgi:hypothetical protein